MKLDPMTLAMVAKTMRDSIKDEIPASPQQQGAFTATMSWADHFERAAKGEPR